MAWSPPYPINVPIAEGERDEGQSEIVMWSEVRDFMVDATPIISKANTAGSGASADAASGLSTGSDGKPALTAADLRSPKLHGSFQQFSSPAIDTSRLLNAKNDVFGSCVILDDPSDSSTWPEKFQFYYQDPTGGVRRTGFFNEYGELRSVAAKRNTVALRAFGSEAHWPGDGSVGPARRPDVPILEVCDDRDQRYRLFGVTVEGGTGVAKVVVNFGNTSTDVGPTPHLHPADNFTVYGTSKFYGAVNATGNITAPNIGVKVTSGTTAPSSPATGDVWVDTT